MNHIYFALVVTCAVFGTTSSASNSNGPTVHLTNGKVRGLEVQVENGQKVHHYSGIRYGKLVMIARCGAFKL